MNTLNELISLNQTPRARTRAPSTLEAMHMGLWVSVPFVTLIGLAIIGILLQS